ncbi:spermidine/putrescine ABC transporter permease PotB [Psychromonas sp. SR45-3]|uniref:spermidine/putrescine ABC transporter permease PotB n=1 Tax=Psychromonas sp. SR45-3 TaxID=2760930 RepID=UPI0015FAA5F1|nr:spermidine/putrescine ABC transporter permease PotB [Psychromonas sp. SR45-3]MBB1273541.1 spermidine/putrescine ABC transporter permease PotB [Psychromonas sp. SR45-3]
MNKQFNQFRFWAIGLATSWLALFVLVPSLMVLVTSFLTRDADFLIQYKFSLEGWKSVFDPTFISLLWDSLSMSMITAVICLAIAYPFVMCLMGLPQRWRGIVLFLLIVPFWTNSLVRIYAIQFLLGKKGLINETLQFVGLIDKPLDMLYSQFAVIFGLSYILLPFMILPIYSSMERLDFKLLDAAKDLGASASQRLMRITLPLTLPGIIAGCLMVVLPAMGMFFVADLLGGSKHALLGNVIKNQFIQTRDWPFGAALSILMILLLSFMLWLYYRATKMSNREGGINDSNF